MAFSPVYRLGLIAMAPATVALVQKAQTELQSLQDAFETHSALLESIEDSLETVENAVVEFNEGETTDARAEALSQARAAVQSAQDDLDTLQDSVGYDDADAARRVESAEEALEAVEDALAELDSDPLVIEVNEEEKEPPERFMTPLEIVRLFEYDPDNVVLYKARAIEEDGSREGDQYLPRDQEIDLRKLNRFACLPSETPYGAAADDSLDDLENEALATDINRLREEYEVDVEDDPKGNFTQVIVRDWPIPSDAYTKDRTDVMIRVPHGYPQQHPDWVYVEENLKLQSGGWPRKHNRDRAKGWLALSWHVNKLNEVTWVPYETDLKWYLDTFCDLRLRQGE
jgi:hypothetical protein